MQPFPWQALPRVRRVDASLLARVSGGLDPVRLEAARATLAALLGAQVSVRPGLVCWEGHVSPAPTLVAVVGEARSGRWALELAPSVALAVVDRVLGGEGEPAPVPGLLDAVERGVVAYVAARLGLAEVHEVLTTGEGLAAWLGEEGAVSWTLEVGLGAQRSGARIWLPARTARALALEAGPPGPLPSWLGEVPVRVALAVGRASLEARQLGALAPGDVLVPDELTYWPGRSTLGEARLTTSGWTARVLWTDDGWQVRSIERTAERERGRIEAEGGAMSEARDDEQASVAEVPVEIAIELGRIELRVRELAALVPGRIVSARVPVGGAVSLRAGDRTIATGELVDLEGELGVRILALHR